MREAVIATAGPGEALAAQLRQAAARMELDDEAEIPASGTPKTSRAERYSWAMLLARIYDCLPLVCPRCGHALKILAFVTEALQVLIRDPQVRQRLARAGEQRVRQEFAMQGGIQKLLGHFSALAGE